jgi:N6-adenosine-specific RNA methylase IME4
MTDPVFPEAWRCHFGVVYADPPWHFKVRSPKGKGRSPDGPLGHYGTMTIPELGRLPVGDLVKPDAVLLLWVLDSMLPEALALGATWGFTYKTVAFTWAKKAKIGDMWAWGLGYWTRRQAEQCLLFTKGRPKRQSRAVGQLVVEKIREHSRKPDIARDKVTALLPGPYLELFARTSAPGWSSWGNETTKFPNSNGDAP